MLLRQLLKGNMATPTAPLTLRVPLPLPMLRLAWLQRTLRPPATRMAPAPVLALALALALAVTGERRSGGKGQAVRRKDEQAEWLGLGTHQL